MLLAWEDGQAKRIAIMPQNSPDSPLRSLSDQTDIGAVKQNTDNTRGICKQRSNRLGSHFHPDLTDA